MIIFFLSPAKMGKHSQQTSGVLWHLVHTDMESRKIAEIMGQCWYIWLYMASNTWYLVVHPAVQGLHFWLSDICIFGVNVLASCYVISTEVVLRRPMTYDNHPIPSIHPIPQSLFNNLNRPWIDLSWPSITSSDLQGDCLIRCYIHP